jgi:hypothetical protein
MRSLPTRLAVFTLCCLPLFAQSKIEILGGQTQRNNTVVLLADTSGGFTPLGLVTITYGVPVWKPEYTAKAEELTKGKMFRLGRDNWAIFDSTLAVKFGSVTVPAGTYYLGISRSKDGATWNLVFIDPAKAKAAGAWPPMPEPAPHAYDVALTHERTEGKITEKLEVAMVNDKAQPTHGTLTITWGDRKLSGTYDMVVENKAAPKDAAGAKGK